MIMRERQDNREWKDRAFLYPDINYSITILGADQSAFVLPHFFARSSDMTRRVMKVKLIGVLENRNPDKLHLFTTTQRHETGATHIVKTVCRFLTDRASCDELLSTLFNQMENCTRENMNQYLSSYAESLASWKVFQNVEVSLLAIGHTYEYIDQAICKTSDQLRGTIAVTVSELHGAMRKAYPRDAQVVP